jgi:hypothetical protein
VDSRPKEGDIKNNDPAWLDEAGNLFGAIRSQLEEFNEQTVEKVLDADKGADRELGKMVELAQPTLARPARGAFAGDPEFGELSDYHAALGRLARLRRRAANLADQAFATKWGSLQKWMFLLTLCAAVLLHFAIHWEPSSKDSKGPGASFWDDPETIAKWLRVTFGGLSVLLVIGIYLKFRSYKLSGHEAYRFDYRALAEGLRVQIYWAAAGLDRSVPANYMQRQRNEMVWIRRAITALAAPYFRWRRWFNALSPADRLAQLKSVVARWVRWDQRLDPTTRTDPDRQRMRKGSQAGYMEDRVHRLDRRERIWRRLGFDLALLGLVQAVIWLVWLGSPTWFESDFWHGARVIAIVTLGAFLVLWAGGAVWATGPVHRAPEAFPRPERGDGSRVWCGFVWARNVVHHHHWIPKAWPRRLRNALWAGQVAAIVGLLCLISAWICVDLGGCFDWFPNAATLWSLVYGSFLICGALAVAWAERNLLAEQARQFAAMSAMYQAAGRRLLGHLQEAEGALARGDRDDFEDRVRAVQELLYQVGLQALDENAEWLILHRSRPLEPVMAG